MSSAVEAVDIAGGLAGFVAAPRFDHVFGLIDTVPCDR